eukprot:1139311-Rhodomonas_salina.1
MHRRTRTITAPATTLGLVGHTMRFVSTGQQLVHEHARGARSPASRKGRRLLRSLHVLEASHAMSITESA